MVFKKWGDNLSPRTGRPKAENPKTTQLSVRLDKETLEKLDEVSKVYSETRVDSIRRGIDKQHLELQMKNK